MFLHPSKALYSMRVTLLGIATLKNLSHLRKQDITIVVIPSGTTRDVISSLFKNNLWLEPWSIKPDSPEILHHANMSAIYIF